MAPTLSKYDEKPEAGDLIEIFRGLYQHWAVYVGDGFVVHLGPPPEVLGACANSMMPVTAEVPGVIANTMISAISATAIVKKEKLCDVVGSDQWKVNNSLDKQYHPHLADVIVKEACAMVGRELPYCPVMSNCEHFATELRYGKAESRQVRVVVEVSILTFLVGLFWTLIAYLWPRRRKENKNTE